MRLIDRLRIYAETYRNSPFRREVEGTAELLEEAAEYIEEFTTDTNAGSKSEFFEKVLKEKLSPETFALISSDEQVFGKWIERLKAMGEDYKRISSNRQRNDEMAEKCIKIGSHYGYTLQSRMLQEEAAELIQAVNKHLRSANSNAMDNLVEELADVQIMMMQVLYLLSIDKEKYGEIITSKLDRQLERMGVIWLN